MDILNTPLNPYEIFYFGSFKPTVGMLLAVFVLATLFDAWLKSSSPQNDPETRAKRFLKALPLSLIIGSGGTFLLFLAGMLACLLVMMAIAVVLNLFGMEGPFPTAKMIVSWISLALSLAFVAFMILKRPRQNLD